MTREQMIDEAVDAERQQETEQRPAPQPDPQHPNRDLIDGLREFCEFLEKHPQPRWMDAVFNVFPDDLAASIRGIGGVEKEIKSNYFCLVKRFGPKVQIEFNQAREKVCEKVVTGTRIVKKPIYEQVKIGEEEVTEEITEWKCPESILAASK